MFRSRGCTHACVTSKDAEATAVDALAKLERQMKIKIKQAKDEVTAALKAEAKAAAAADLARSEAARMAQAGGCSW